MRSSSYWISRLSLHAHPEGGYFRETYRASESIDKESLPNRFDGQRTFSTAIYFLLESQQFSHFHRIKSDELWHFHDGTPLNIYVLRSNGLVRHILGLDVEKGESPQVVVPANCWFGACTELSDSYTLASCTVAPGFDFADFEMAERRNLLREFPDHEETITKLTR